MRYFVCKKEKDKLLLIKTYFNEQILQRELVLHIKKEKKNLIIVPIPEIVIGAKIYKKDTSYYGTIAYETKTLWGISHEEKPDAMPDAFNKDRFDEWILQNDYLIVDNNIFKIPEDTYNYIVQTEEKYNALIKEIDYVNTEQIAFL